MLRHVITSGLVALVLVGFSMSAGAGSKPAPPSGSTHAAKSRPSRDGWPDTRAAARASGWVEAFSTGEDAMRAYLKENMAEPALAERGVARRIESYRNLRDRLGALVLGSVDESMPYEVRVSLLAENASVHRFVFKVEEKAPHKLISVGMLEHRGHGGAGMHGHGH